jgi:hypothetical protein
MRAVMAILLLKVLIIIAVVGIVRSFPRFRTMSRELDQDVYRALKRLMRATEEHGYPPQLIPFLLLLTAVSFMLSQHVREAFGR